jgi:uncharacterized protein YndB with AHSA1/START domain
MPDSLHDVTIAAPPERVFELLTTESGLRAWWTAGSRAAPAPGSVNVFAFDGGAIEFHFRVDESLAPRRLAWTCLAAPKVPAEWVGTRITAELGAEGGSTRLRFAHRGWASDQGAYAMCNTTWGHLMHRLRDAAEGRGPGPYFPG